MSIDLVANIASVVPQMFYKEGVFLFNREAPLLSIAKKRRGHSRALFWATAFSGAGAGLIGEGEDINTSEYLVDDRTQFTLSRAIYRSAFALSHSELAVVQSLTPDAAADIVIDRLKDAWLESLAQLAKQIEIDLAVGTGTGTSVSTGSPVNAIVGWTNALRTTGLYAGVNVATYAGAQSNLFPGTGSLTQAKIDDAIAAIIQAAGSMAPDFMMCSPKTYAAVKAVADQNVRFWSMEEAAKYQIGLPDVPVSNRPLIAFDGIPVLTNSQWGSSGANLDGYLLIGNSKSMEVDYLPYGNGWGDSVLLDPKEAQEMFGNKRNGVGLEFLSYAPAKTGASVKMAMEAELQLAVTAPNRFAVLSGISLV